jgi:hypothetical protein
MYAILQGNNFVLSQKPVGHMVWRMEVKLQSCSFTGKFDLAYFTGKFTGNYRKLPKNKKINIESNNW